MKCRNGSTPFFTRAEAAEARVKALEAEREGYKDALTAIDAIRNSIVGTQTINWSAHIYPLVAALEKAGFAGEGYEVAREKARTLIQHRDQAEAKAETLSRALSEAREALGPFAALGSTEHYRDKPTFVRAVRAVAAIEKALGNAG